jgi:hypothetical protein
MNDSKYAILGDKIFRYAYGHRDVTADWDKSKVHPLELLLQTGIY